MPRSFYSSHNNWSMGYGGSYDPYGGGYADYGYPGRRQRVGAPLVGSSYSDTASEDAVLVSVRYWDNWAKSALAAAKAKWLFAFAVKGQYQPALDLVNQAIYGFQQEREAASKFMSWGSDYLCNQGPAQFNTWECGAYDLAKSYDAEAAKMIGVLIAIQTELHKQLTLSQITISLPPPQQHYLTGPWNPTSIGRKQVGQTMAHYFISDPEIHPAFIGDPNIHAPTYLATHIIPQHPIGVPVERFRFVTWGSSGFVPAPVDAWALKVWAKDGWALSGNALCQVAENLDAFYPAITLYLVSSTRGWLSPSGATASQWLSFLSCNPKL